MTASTDPSGTTARTRPGRRLRRAVSVAAVAAAVALLAAACTPPGGGGGSGAARHAIGHEGRWLTDARGRVVMLHGVNFVAKEPGVTPASMGFDADDAAWLADNGFDVVRLGTIAESIMPEPGVIDHAYLDSFFKTVDQITAEGLQVLIDLHQDGWGATLGNQNDGFPGWMTITDGEVSTNTPFPLYYVTNPAIQAAFDNLWANTPGVGDVPLQERVAAIFEAFAARARHRPGILGYDLLNEPWPGRIWEACAYDVANGCPEQDARLSAYNDRMARAVRTRDRTHLVFGEPYVLFNFGNAPTNVRVPNDDARGGLSYHLYTLDPSFDPAVQRFAIEWSERTGGALLNTEWGATTDPVAVQRQVDELDGALIPWIWWAYNEGVIRNTHQPPSEENIVTRVVDVLVRPRPAAVAGTPRSYSYDAASRTMAFTYSTARPGWGRVPAGVPGVSEFKVAPRTYPGGYRATATGGVVVSRPGAKVLKVLSRPGAAEVKVTIAPAN